MRIKKTLLLSIVVLLPILLLSTSCSKNEAEEDKSSISEELSSLGYENCLMCHIGGTVALSHHCLHFDPVEYVRIPYKAYSPSLDDCLLCHTSHLPEGQKLYTIVHGAT
jgi:hypothetical protein